MRRNWLIFLLLLSICLFIVTIISFTGLIAGAFFFISLVGLTVVVISFKDYRIGYLILLVYSFFMFFIGRMIPFNFPMGIFVEILYILIFISIIISANRNGTVEAKGVFSNPIGFALLIFVGFAYLQIFNPNSNSIAGKVMSIRDTTSTLIAFFVAMHIFDSVKTIKLFTKIWLGLALLTALYGFYQEYVGFTSFEIRHEMAAGGLKPIMGRIRKWSFLSDVNAFGLFMSFSAIICFILLLGDFSIRKKVILAISGVIMSISMTYSGTRTAFAMIILGLAFYILMSINNRRTVMFAAISLLVFLAIIYGPFYGGTFSRLRTTFRGSEDASMAVRDGKRLRLQPYARENPFGGGINTAGNVGLRYEPNHPLAGQFDPDSGYLRMALERGWIGLLVNFGLYSTILIFATINYFKVKNRQIKILYAAYMAGFFALSIANFTQDSMDQKPVVIILFASYAIFVKAIDFDTKYII